MKKNKNTRLLLVVIILFIATGVSNCSIHSTTYKTKKIPPGQAKKSDGAKSAKNYTPAKNKSY